MDNELNNLFESDLLTEETKRVLQESWNTALEAEKAKVEADYATKLDEQKAEMVSTAIEMVEEAVTEELSKISDEIKEARSLEVNYAEKLETFKEQYDEKMQEQMTTMVAEAVAEEVEALKEDIEFAKKHQFAMDMFESFKDTYTKTFGTGDLDTHSQLEEAQKELDSLKREKTLNGLLEGLEGNKRKVAQTILESVSTDNLEERFNSLRPILMQESKEEEGGEVIEESASGEEETKGRVVVEESEETASESRISDDVAKRLQRSLKFARG